jgi:NTE family protein
MTSATDTSGQAADGPLVADLVLEGGGVKGLALVGAVSVFAGAGYTFARVAGTSAGAVVGSVVAALQHAGEPLSRLEDVARSLDYRKLRDRGLLGRIAGPLSPVVDGLSLAFESGIFEGEYLHDWLSGTLRDLGVRTFGDLRRQDPGDDPAAPLDPEHSYGLVVTASDLSRRRLVRLPWDYPLYGLDPDEQPVADAVRASSSIPFYYEPITLRSPDKSVSTLVDGGVLSNFPIALFDRTDGRPPRWPTFGVRLSSKPGRTQSRAVDGPVSLALAVVETLIEACDAQHIDDPCVQARSVFVDTSGTSAVDFTIPEEQKSELVAAGAAAARHFLAGWDWPRYLATCRAGDDAAGAGPAQGEGDR